MRPVRDHYSSHLARIYSWMCGGADTALARGNAELDALGLASRATGLAVDLGAGFGMHSIPLARRGYEVLAVDGCGDLLRELRMLAGSLQIQAAEADILSFRKYLGGTPDLVLCMGDTLTHLADRCAVESLIGDVAAAIAPGGAFVLSLRDYSIPLRGEDRFIHVRSDPDRILTCFLEYADTHVDVHDLLYERDGSAWRQRVSAYRKLRLSPDWLESTLEQAGFRTRREAGLTGMIRLVAEARPR